MDEAENKKEERKSADVTEIVEEVEHKDKGGPEILKSAYKSGAKLVEETGQVYGAVKGRYDKFQAQRREDEFRRLEGRESEVKARYELAKRKDDIRTLEKEESRLRNKPMSELLSGIGSTLRGVGRRREEPRYRRAPRYAPRGRYREPPRRMERREERWGTDSGASRLLTGTSSFAEPRQSRRFERPEAPSGIAAALHGTGQGAASMLSGSFGSRKGFPDFGGFRKRR